MTASVSVSLYNIVVIEKTVSEFRNASAGELLVGREGKHRIGAKTYPTEADSAGGVSCWPRGAWCPLRVSVLIRCWQVGHSAPTEARVGEGISYCLCTVSTPPPMSFVHEPLEQARGWRGKTDTGPQGGSTWRPDYCQGLSFPLLISLSLCIWRRALKEMVVVV